ncbi:MAG: twin-arginine translocase subunit TatC [Nitrososphaerales archaeon]
MADDNDSDFNEARAEVFEAIGHPTRIRILQALNERPLGFGELKKEVGIGSSGHLEFHLRKLAHLIRTDEAGSYTLTDDGREAIRLIRNVWSENPHGTASQEARNRVWTRAALAAFVVLLVALVAIPSGITISIGPGGSFRPLVGLFIQEIDRQMLPAGRTLIASGDLSAPLEIYAAASITLALLFASPGVAYVVIRRLGPGLTGRRRLTYGLVALASILVAFGALFGYLVLGNLAFGSGVQQIVQNQSPPPGSFLDATDFYFGALGIIGASAVAFALPLCLFVRVRFRTK